MWDTGQESNFERELFAQERADNHGLTYLEQYAKSPVIQTKMDELARVHAEVERYVRDVQEKCPHSVVGEASDSLTVDIRECLNCGLREVAYPGDPNAYNTHDQYGQAFDDLADAEGREVLKFRSKHNLPENVPVTFYTR